MCSALFKGILIFHARLTKIIMKVWEFVVGDPVKVIKRRANNPPHKSINDAFQQGPSQSMVISIVTLAIGSLSAACMHPPFSQLLTVLNALCVT